MLAFLDINPISHGHTLVVPKEPAETLDKLSDQAAAGVGRALPRICRAVLRATGASAYNVLQNNGRAAHQEIDHVHFHVIPRFVDRADGAGLGIEWAPQKPDSERLAELARHIARLL